MDESAVAARSCAGIRAVLVPTRWRLWAEPPQFLVYWSVSVVTAAGLTVVTAVTVPTRPRDLVMLGVLAGLGVAQAEAGRKIERVRRMAARSPHINLSSVWTFAGVLLLPPAMTVVLIAVLYAHLSVRSWKRLRAAPAYRTVANVCLVSLTCFASYRVLTWSGVDDIYAALDRGWASAGSLGAAILTYFVVAAVIAIPGVRPADHTPTESHPEANRGRSRLLGDLGDNVLEATTLATGAVVAFLLVSPLPYLVIAVVALLVWAHHAVLDRQLQLLGETDDTTGLANTKGWYRIATETLTRAEHDHSTVAILVIKVDDWANLTHGYRRLAGDNVLAAIADTLRTNAGDHDGIAIGRFTGPEFVVLLPDTTEQQAMQTAERIRTAVAYLRVPVVNVHGRTEVIVGMSVSIGVALYPAAGTAIHKLLSAADAALDQGRHYGSRRNQVRLAPTA